MNYSKNDLLHGAHSAVTAAPRRFLKKMLLLFTFYPELT